MRLFRRKESASYQQFASSKRRPRSLLSCYGYAEVCGPDSNGKAIGLIGRLALTNADLFDPAIMERIVNPRPRRVDWLATVVDGVTC